MIDFWHMYAAENNVIIGDGPLILPKSWSFTNRVAANFAAFLSYLTSPALW